MSSESVLPLIDRLTSHPPVTRPSPSLNPPSSLPSRAEADSCEKTHSAPSSPTREQPPAIIPRNDMRRSNSPSARPRSVMVNSDLTYSELQFPPASHPTPRPRIHTNYTEVVPPDSSTQEETEALRKPLGETQETQTGRQESGEQFDPFTEDEGADSTWSDPMAFYDRPQPARPAVPIPPPRDHEREQEIGAKDERRDNQGGENSVNGDESSSDANADDDCTGGSAYMDTSQFLRTNVPSSSKLFSTADEMLSLQLCDARHEDNTTPINSDEGPGELGQYDFPSALANFPTNRDVPTKREVVDDGLDSRSSSHSSECISECLCSRGGGTMGHVYICCFS